MSDGTVRQLGRGNTAVAMTQLRKVCCDANAVTDSEVYCALIAWR
jgi:hypothetical protein